MVYLEKPKTDIEWAEGSNAANKIQYTAGEMQGWRLNMVSEYPTQPKGKLTACLCVGRRAHFELRICREAKSFRSL